MASPAHAQNQKNIWYLGHMGLDFNGGAPAVLTLAMASGEEGVASVADPTTGELLLYTDGVTIWGRDSRVIDNGGDLWGGFSATQSSLIVPMPGNPLEYMVFTVAHMDSLRGTHLTGGVTYSVVRSIRGRWMVVRKNVILDPFTSEKITAVRHCNGHDYWVITRGWRDDFFHAFLVTDSGVSPLPVTSRGGRTPTAYSAGIGYMKASPNGAWLALTTYGEGAVELYPFDNAAGRVGSVIPLASDTGAYGVSFSPDNSKLYISNTFTDRLDQYDLASGDAAAIGASRYTQYAAPANRGMYSFGALQIAPDGRIYLARRESHELGVINNPNARGAAMNFVEKGLSLGNGYLTYGLPNMIDADIPPALCLPPRGAFDYFPVICEGLCNVFTDMSQGEPTSWRWSFPGAIPEVSTEPSPRSVCYREPGVYDVTLIVANAFGSDTIRRTVVVKGEQLALDSTAHPVISRIQLDTTLLNTTRCDSIVLANRGETPLTLGPRDAYLLTGRDFAIAPGQYPFTIPPHGRRGLRICYTPSSVGEEHDGLVLVDSCLAIVAYIYAAGSVSPPSPAFTFASAEPCRRECIDFTDRSGSTATAWHWLFQGAEPPFSDERSPRSVCFTGAGEHVVTLIAANSYGADTLTRTIVVEGTPRPAIASALDSGSLTLQPLGIGGYRWESVMIRAGDAPVTIRSARLAVNTAYSIPAGQFPLSIPAGESRALRIGYAPSSEGEQRDTLLIDDDCAPIALPLAGRALFALGDGVVCSTRIGFRGVAAGGYLRVDAPHPNPAASRIAIPVDLLFPDGADATMRCTLHDALGRLVGEGRYAGWRSGDGRGSFRERGLFTLDVGRLAGGTYYATIVVGQSASTLPVIVGR